MPKPVLLIGFQDQANLGVGYLAAVLRAENLVVEILDLRAGTEAITRRVLDADPVLVGFSLIFQYHVGLYGRIVRHLRAAGVTSHITVGGHYPSLNPGGALTRIPGVDSVVRFEGELTLLELVRALHRDTEWRRINGIAYRAPDGSVVQTPPRPLVMDLDQLPTPVREGPAPRILGMPTMPLLASRGCSLRCSFCSINAFYRGAPGRTVRVRAPERVVAEMVDLHRAYGTRIFLFQDDDFPVRGRPGRRWAGRFVDELDRVGLAGRVLFKISCRVDDVERTAFADLRGAGLFLVYLGLESGTDEGLAELNKGATAAQGLRAIDVLTEAGLIFRYGFMLIDPSSSFESVRSNLAFLQRVVAHDDVAATFCRMLPYEGTPIHDRLVAEGRLRGDLERPDYEMRDARLAPFFSRLEVAASPWMGTGGLSHTVDTAWQEATILRRLFPPVPGMAAYERGLRILTRSSNDALLGLAAEELARAEAGSASMRPWESREAAAKTAGRLADELLALRDGFVAANQAQLLQFLDASGIWREES